MCRHLALYAIGPPLLFILNDVMKFMGQKSSTRVRCRKIPVFSENHMAADRIGVGIEGMRRLLRLGVRIDPHPAQIVAEARFKKRSCRFIQRSA